MWNEIYISYYFGRGAAWCALAVRNENLIFFWLRWWSWPGVSWYDSAFHPRYWRTVTAQLWFMVNVCFRLGCGEGGGGELNNICDISALCLEFYLLLVFCLRNHSNRLHTVRFCCERKTNLIIQSIKFGTNYSAPHFIHVTAKTTCCWGTVSIRMHI